MHDSPLRIAKSGDRIPDLVRLVTRTTVFLFSAATFGTHRFHYDVESARAEGFDDVLVTSNLIASYFEQAVRGWSGNATSLLTLEERSISPAIAGDTIVISGTIESVERSNEACAVRIALSATTHEGRAVSSGVAELVEPAAKRTLG